MIALAWLCDVWIVVTYFLTARSSKYLDWFNLANFVGGLGLIYYTVVVSAWGTLPLTAAFTAIGGYGLFRRIRCRS